VPDMSAYGYMYCPAAMFARMTALPADRVAKVRCRERCLARAGGARVYTAGGGETSRGVLRPATLELRLRPHQYRQTRSTLLPDRSSKLCRQQAEEGRRLRERRDHLEKQESPVQITVSAPLITRPRILSRSWHPVTLLARAVRVTGTGIAASPRRSLAGDYRKMTKSKCVCRIRESRFLVLGSLVVLYLDPSLLETTEP
jgi:hypothetical protein